MGIVSSVRFGRGRLSLFFYLVAVIGGLAAVAPLLAQQPIIPTTNVNVISGTGPDGDWTLQRQNEPSGACSSRNPLNCMVGANDYRTVDIPNPNDANRVIGDAWLGWYTTKDGGQTWRTRLLPGFPQDVSPQGLASPLKGMEAGADPVVRSGGNGMFFYAGIAFVRGTGGASRLFVARFIDNNDRERPDAESIQYIDTSVIQAAPQGTVSNFFVDKPWIAVDIPREGGRRCRLGGRKTGVERQTVPCARVYVAYTVLAGVAPDQIGTIMVAHSEDSGATWSVPQPIRMDADVNDDGQVTAADTAAVKAGNGQKCQTAAYQYALDVNLDCAVNSRDSSLVSRLVGTAFPNTLPKVHQGAALAIAPSSGAVYLAWRQLSFPFRTDPDQILASRSTDGGVTFTPPAVVSPLNPFDQGSSATTFRTNAFPSLAIDGEGRGYLTWTTRGLVPGQDPIEGDSRVVVSTSADGLTWLPPQPVDNHPERGHQFMPSIAFVSGQLQLLYYDQRQDLSGVYARFVDEQQALSGPRVRHTTEVHAATAAAGPSPVFTSVRVTDYLFGLVPGSSQSTQLQYDPPNLPLFRQGTTPFNGDYIDIFPSRPILTVGGTSMFNTVPTGSPLFHAVWTDNRDVRPPANGDWTKYTPPIPSFPRPTVSGFDPLLSVPPCEPGFVATRNQNVYTAQVSAGLIAAALTNFKQLGTVQRSFPIYAQNTTSIRRSYRITIRTQPVGGTASLLQFSPLTTLDVAVPARSTVARTVYVTSTDTRASVPIDVVEITAPGGDVVAGGQSAEIVLNPDPSNPDVENPDVENPDVENPDVENPDVSNVEVYNPDVENAAVLGLANPDVENPDVENPDVENTVVLNPAIVTPDVENPDVENPDVENPDVENPDVENLDLVNGGLSDTTWTLTNRGNTAASYSLKMLLNRGFPVGFRSQLLVHRVYQTPAVQGCELKQQTQNILLVNLPDPSFTKLTATTGAAGAAAGARVAALAAAASALEPGVEDPDIDNVTFAIPPGESVVVTLRVYDPDRTDAEVFDAAAAVTPAMIAQAVETEAVAAGETAPEVAAPLLPDATPPDAPANTPYSYTLPSIGTGTWSVAGGTLPTGLTLDSSTGQITGIATVGGTFGFVAQFVRDDGTSDYENVVITVAGASAFADLAVTTVPTPNPGTVGAPMTYLTTVSNAGPSPASNVMLTQSLPLGVTALSVTSSQGTCTATSHVQCNLGTVAVGSPVTVTLTMTPGASGFAQSTATVSSATGDAQVANNGATVSALIQAFAPCATPSLKGPKAFPVPDPARGNFVLMAEDVNRDGHLDAIMSHGSSAHISVMLGDGTGEFGPPSLMAGPAGLLGLAVADFNEDGSLDIVAGSGSNPNLSLYFGNGDGTFVTPATLIPAINTFVPEPGDFNNDGDVDLIVGGNGNGQRAFLAGRGDGTFAPAVTETIGTGTMQFVLGDYNRDGNLDLATSGAGIGPSGSIRLYLGDGLGGFVPGTTVTVGTGARVRQGLGDVNLDGNLDLAVTTGSGNTVNAQTFVLFGDGGGGFATPLDLNSGPYSQYTSAADLTGDGLPDVLTVHPLAGALTVQLGGGGSTFGPPITFAVQEAIFLRIKDVNHDNRPDVLMFSSDEPPSLHVMLNTCGGPPADVSITANDAPDPVAPGAVLTYTVNVTNNGPNPATDVIVNAASDVNGLDLVSIDTSLGACVPGPSGVGCNFGTLAVGQTETLTLELSTIAGGSIVPVTVAATANEADPDTTNNGVTLTTTVTVAPMTFSVTSTADDFSFGTLRRAIDDANLNQGPDTIEFNIGSGPQTINILSPLPSINSPLTIDGTTQPGWSMHNPVIELNGAAAGGNAGLLINAGSTTIRGLIINRFPGNGIFVSGSGGGAVIEGNIIGTNLAGAAGIGNAFAGVSVQSPTTIGGPTPASRNVISGNGQNGIFIGAQILPGNVLGTSGAGSVVANNYIGTNPAGTGAVASINNSAGVNLRVPNVTVTGNVISGNGLAGSNGWGILALALTPSGSTTILTGPSGLVVQGNRIGTNANGDAPVPNVTGISLNAGSAQIGGTVAGQGNVISGNTGPGLFLTFQTTGGATPQLVTQSSGVLVQGNIVGLDASGSAALPNGTSNGNPGISIVTSNHTIGGTSPAARNVISGNGNVANGGNGISINGNATFGIVAATNTIVGNYIGLNAAGTAAIANRSSGIGINGNGNVVGGDTAGAGNIISGNNTNGIAITGGTGTIVKGNRVGTNPAGTAAIPNLGFGVNISNSNNNLIGGAAAGARNLLSGNGVASGSGQNGVLINSGTGNQILGNYIGTDITGTSAIPNTAHGIGVFGTAAGTMIGGINAGEGNLISGNGVAPVFGSGIQLGSSGAAGSIVRGNLVGTNASGTGAIPNRTSGIGITSNNNTIGGSSAAARNVISGNGNGAVFSPGVQIFQTASGNQVLGNYIGTDITGTLSLPNNSSGVFVSDTASNNIIGDDVPGAGNVISGNGAIGQFAVGVRLGGGSGNVVQGNFIGTNAAGTGAVPNTNGGIDISTSGNIVGGLTSAARNVISGNGVGTNFAPGININNSSNNQILGNYIGTDASGGGIVANTNSGVQLTGTGTGNVIGGAAAGARNLISGNGKNGQFASGINIIGPTSGTIVQGNFIGTDASGTAALPNANGGVDINNSTGNLIGGTNAGEGNLISGNGSAAGAPGNEGQGILMSSGASGNQIFGNLIGTDVNGTAALANDEGVQLSGTSSNNVVGGMAPGEAPNTIAFNDGRGIIMFPGNGLGNRFSGNSIHSNGALGIDLGGGGPDLNDGDDVDLGENEKQNSPQITSATTTGGQTTVIGTLDSTPGTSFTVELFSNTACDGSGRGEGRTLIATFTVVITTGDGSFSTVIPINTSGLFITGTATNPGNSTSEFSNCVAVMP